MIFVGASVAGQLLLGLTIALIIQRAVARKLHGAVLVRSVVLSAWVMPGILIGVVWQIVLNEGPFGLVNSALGSVGMDAGVVAVGHEARGRLGRRRRTSGAARRSRCCCSTPRCTRSTGAVEQSKVDGAGRLRTLWHVTLPQIRPVLLVNMILITIATLNTFDMILALTGGGPAQATEVLALRTYNSVFVNFNLASGCVFAVSAASRA